MPWVKISSDAHKALKEYLVDIEGLTLGKLVEEALGYAMENLDAEPRLREGFEKFLELEDVEDESEEDETEENETEKEDEGE